MDSQELRSKLTDLKNRLDDLKLNVLEIDKKKLRLDAIESELLQEKVWKKYLILKD